VYRSLNPPLEILPSLLKCIVMHLLVDSMTVVLETLPQYLAIVGDLSRCPLINYNT